MVNNEWIKDYITLRGEEIPVKIGFLPHERLLFFTENPRVYSVLTSWDKEPSQEDIEQMLIRREHVKQLIQSIKANGGLTDPIFVRDGVYIVLEGNSRLAAYRALSKKDPIKWGKIKCKILPENIDESKIFALLGEYHIIGKQDWAPFEQAGYLYRRYKYHSTDPHKMAIDLGLSVRKVNHLIKVYSFMIKHKDNNPTRWSYYDEYLKSTKIKKVREKYSDFDKIVVTKIKSGEIPKAADVRDNLSKIAISGDKILRGFLTEKNDFHECVERAVSGGVDKHCYLKIKKFKEWLINSSVAEELVGLPDSIIKKCLYEFKKIKSGIDHLERILQK